MVPNGIEILKTLLLLQIAVKSFETSSVFSPQWSSQNGVFEILSFDF